MNKSGVCFSICISMQYVYIYTHSKSFVPCNNFLHGFFPIAHPLVHLIIIHSFTSFISIYETKASAIRASSSVIYTGYLSLNILNRR